MCQAARPENITPPASWNNYLALHYRGCYRLNVIFGLRRNYAQAKIRPNGKVRVTQVTEEVVSTATCSNKFTQIVDTEQTSPIVGFAKVTGTTTPPTVRNFGGRDVTSASVSRAATGTYFVTLTGGVDSRFTFDGLAVFCSVDAGGFCSAFISNDVTTSNQEIEIGIQTTDTSGSPANKDFSVAMLLGAEQ